MIEVKICGLTDPDEALGCVNLGADAIGCVFYSKSPRNLTDEQAKAVCAVLPPEVVSVGVFVNESFSNIMHKVEFCGLKAVQLHGQETPELVRQLRNERLPVIKALFAERKPRLDEIKTYGASAYLVECGKGPLPGGNALSWNWRMARTLGEEYPLILAGGIVPDNVYHAVSAALPDAVDVSSGVEFSPGKKDLVKVKALMDALSQCTIDKTIRRIFHVQR